MMNKKTIQIVAFLAFAALLPGIPALASEITGTLSSGGTLATSTPSSTSTIGGTVVPGSTLGGTVLPGGSTIGGTVIPGSTIGGTVVPGSTIGGTVTGGGSTGGGGGGGGSVTITPAGGTGASNVPLGSGGGGGGIVLGASTVAQNNAPAITPTADVGPALPGAGYPPVSGNWMAIGLMAASILAAILYRQRIAK